ncbi:hypothetical protein DFH06DRAFT_1323332 [Mycena polygramma]|nr:hypothetical protein DFH06DRAFT_1323332 [Mycena polygramma]
MDITNATALFMILGYPHATARISMQTNDHGRDRELPTPVEIVKLKRPILSHSGRLELRLKESSLRHDPISLTKNPHDPMCDPKIHRSLKGALTTDVSDDPPPLEGALTTDDPDDPPPLEGALTTDDPDDPPPLGDTLVHYDTRAPDFHAAALVRRYLTPGVPLFKSTASPEEMKDSDPSLAMIQSALLFYDMSCPYRLHINPEKGETDGEGVEHVWTAMKHRPMRAKL